MNNTSSKHPDYEKSKYKKKGRNENELTEKHEKIKRQHKKRNKLPAILKERTIEVRSMKEVNRYYMIDNRLLPQRKVREVIKSRERQTSGFVRDVLFRWRRIRRKNLCTKFR